MILKPSVIFNGVQAPVLRAMAAAEEVFGPYGDVVVTSIKDGTHSANSLHYDGLAFDLRTRHMDKGQVAAAAEALAIALGKDYDVVIEGDHLHVEYDVRRK